MMPKSSLLFLELCNFYSVSVVCLFKVQFKYQTSLFELAIKKIKKFSHDTSLKVLLIAPTLHSTTKGQAQGSDDTLARARFAGVT